MAEANVALAASQGAAGTARCSPATPPGLLDLVPASAVGRVGTRAHLPPYGRGTHGLVQATSTGVRKRDHLYGDREPATSPMRGWSRLLDGFAAILAASYQLLRPGGIVVITCRPVRRQRDDLIDLPGELLAVARSVGLVPVQRCAAMLAAVRDGQIVHRATMFGLMAVRRAGTRASPCTWWRTRTCWSCVATDVRRRVRQLRLQRSPRAGCSWSQRVGRPVNAVGSPVPG